MEIKGKSKLVWILVTLWRGGGNFGGLTRQYNGVITGEKNEFKESKELHKSNSVKDKMPNWYMKYLYKTPPG